MEITRFNTKEAIEYGMKEAILIEYFRCWIGLNKKKNVNTKNGKTWFYNACSEISSNFGFMSEQTVRNTINSLIKQGVLISGNYNKVRFDRTLWYAFADEEKFLS